MAKLQIILDCTVLVDQQNRKLQSSLGPWSFTQEDCDTTYWVSDTECWKQSQKDNARALSYKDVDK